VPAPLKQSITTAGTTSASRCSQVRSHVVSPRPRWKFGRRVVKPSSRPWSSALRWRAASKSARTSSGIGSFSTTRRQGAPQTAQTPFSLVPALTQGITRSGGNVAKCASVNGFGLMVQTVRRLRVPS
jgi:hypothetical protein